MILTLFYVPKSLLLNTALRSIPYMERAGFLCWFFIFQLDLRFKSCTVFQPMLSGVLCSSSLQGSLLDKPWKHTDLYTSIEATRYCKQVKECFLGLSEHFLNPGPITVLIILDIGLAYEPILCWFYQNCLL